LGQPQGIATTTSFSIKFDHHYIINQTRQPQGTAMTLGQLPERFPNFELDVFKNMPNHIHGIILLNDCVVRAGFTPAYL
jgi:hypothetical protein